MVGMTVQGVAAITAKLHAGLVLIPAAAIVRDAAAFAAREAAAGAPRDTGAIARSFVAQVHGLSAKVRSTSPAAMAIEYGRHPGRALPPVADLRGWAQRRGLSGLEFVIARAIARRGIKGRFFMRRATDKLRQHELPRLVEVAKRAIHAAWIR